MTEPTLGALRAKFRDFPESSKAAIAEEVDAWRGQPEDFGDRMARAITKIPESNIVEWLERAMQKGDPSMGSRIMEVVERIQFQKKQQDLVYKVVPYTIKDESVAGIILKGPDALYPEWEEAMIQRARRRGLDEFIDRCERWLEKAKALRAKRNPDKSDIGSAASAAGR